MWSGALPLGSPFRSRVVEQIGEGGAAGEPAAAGTECLVDREPRFAGSIGNWAAFTSGPLSVTSIVGVGPAENRGHG